MIGIIGGGLTGLTLARHLKEKAVILEKLPETGGLCRTHVGDGFTFDIGGSHIIFSKNKEILDFMVSVLGDNVEKNRRNTKILYNGRLVKYPFENGLSDLPLLENMECIISFLVNLGLKKLGLVKQPTNFKEGLYYVFGKGIAEKYLIPYNEKIWNIKTEEMDYSWQKDRLPQPDPVSLIKASLGMESEGYVHQLHFYYPKRGGIQAMVDGIKKGSKAQLVLNYEVKSIKKVKEEFEVSDGRRPMRFSKLVSTMPLPDLIERIQDPVPSEVKQAAKRLQFNSIITILIGVNTPNLSNVSWMYIPSEDDGAFNRIAFPFNFSRHTTPEGKTSVLAEITYNEGDDVSKMTDKEVINHVIDKLDGDKLIDKRKVCHSSIRRLKHAYVVYDKEHFKNKEPVKKFVEEYGIQLCGRFSEFDYLNMDACIKRAIERAKALNGEKSS